MLFLFFVNQPTLHSWGVNRGRSVAVAMAVCVRDMWEVTGDRCQVTQAAWHVTKLVEIFFLFYFCLNFHKFLVLVLLSTNVKRVIVSRRQNFVYQKRKVTLIVLMLIVIKTWVYFSKQTFSKKTDALTWLNPIHCFFCIPLNFQSSSE